MPYLFIARIDMNKHTDTNQLDNETGMIALSVWLARMGRSDTTGWRWAKNGWIHPINISGKNYIDRQDRTQFEERAARGEFAKAPRGAAKTKGKSAAHQN